MNAVMNTRVCMPIDQFTCFSNVRCLLLLKGFDIDTCITFPREDNAVAKYNLEH
jgi:hypothetical protein